MARPGCGGSCATTDTTRVAVLDGGAGRVAGRGAAAHGRPESRPGRRPHAPTRAADVVDADGAAAAAVLLDARAPERFRGDTEPLDPVAGHIPGAANLPFAELAPSGGSSTRRAAPAPGGRRSGPGADVAAYCGSGVTACTIVLAAEVAGTGPVRLYSGSWSEWSRAGRPAER